MRFMAVNTPSHELLWKHVCRRIQSESHEHTSQRAKSDQRAAAAPCKARIAGPLLPHKLLQGGGAKAVNITRRRQIIRKIDERTSAEFEDMYKGYFIFPNKIAKHSLLAYHLVGQTTQ